MLGLEVFDFLFFKGARAIGDVAGVVNKCRTARTRSAAVHLDGYAWINLAVGVGPRNGEVHHRIGADVGDGRLLAARGTAGASTAARIRLAAAAQEQSDGHG